MSTDLEKERLAALAQHLVEATAQRRADWDVRDEDVYVWGAAEGSVTVASRDRDGEPPYELALFTADGRKIDQLESELLIGDEPAPWNEALAELYRIARRSALGADEIIDALLERLAEASDPHQSILERARAGFSPPDGP
jgi:hypothetical protein